MILYPAEWNARKEAVFTALAKADGGGRRLVTIPWSRRDFPETKARVALCLSRAKRQPQGLGRWVKAQLIRLQYNGARQLFALHPAAVAVAWNGLGGSRQAFMLAAKDAGLATLYCELAPFPGRMTVDPLGVNADGSIPFMDLTHFDTSDRWRALGDTLTARTSRRADVGQAEGTPQGRYLFCPLQVPNDSQVTLFAGWTGGMDGFLHALTQAAPHLPEGWHLRLKEHPSAKTTLTAALQPLLATGRAILDNATDSFTQLAAAHAVVTLNSSMGLQAFFHDKPVVTLGRAFFAHAPLVTPAPDQATLNAAFQSPAILTYDPTKRAQLMNWLDQVYYPDPTDPSAMAEKLRQARNLVRAPSPPTPFALPATRP